MFLSLAPVTAFTLTQPLQRNGQAVREDASFQIGCRVILISLPAGGIPVLVVALDSKLRSAAVAAHQVILALLDLSMLSGKLVKANEEMLARMQGLHRHANLLCPTFEIEVDTTDRVNAAGDHATLSQDATPFLVPHQFGLQLG